MRFFMAGKGGVHGWIFLLILSLAACGSEEEVESKAPPRLKKRLPEPKKAESIVLSGHGAGVMSVAYGPDGKFAISGSKDRTIKLWDLEKGLVVGNWTGHEGSVISVAFGPYGKLALSGSADKTVRLWNVRTGRVIETFEGHEYGVTAVAISPDEIGRAHV